MVISSLPETINNNTFLAPVIRLSFKSGESKALVIAKIEKPEAISDIDNIILSTRNVPMTEEYDSTELFKQHKRIEEEFSNKILHVGKQLNYVEFENLLNK